MKLWLHHWILPLGAGLISLLLLFVLLPGWMPLAKTGAKETDREDSSFLNVPSPEEIRLENQPDTQLAAWAAALSEDPVEVRNLPAYQHYIQTDFISSEMTGRYSLVYLEDIRHQENHLAYENSQEKEEARYSLSEIVSFYCSDSQSISYTDQEDGTGFYLQVSEEDWPRLCQEVAAADALWAAYPLQIEAICSLLELDSSDASLVDQINAYICGNYEYEVTNSGMPLFMSSHKGQCWHYAKLFADLCNALGIPAWKIENTRHAWVCVQIDGEFWIFDPTFNDTGNNWTAYSWMKQHA